MNSKYLGIHYFNHLSSQFMPKENTYHSIPFLNHLFDKYKHRGVYFRHQSLRLHIVGLGTYHIRERRTILLCYYIIMFRVENV